jgi:hypothetical protein
LDGCNPRAGVHDVRDAAVVAEEDRLEGGRGGVAGHAEGLGEGLQHLLLGRRGEAHLAHLVHPVLRRRPLLLRLRLLHRHLPRPLPPPALGVAPRTAPPGLHAHHLQLSSRARARGSGGSIMVVLLLLLLLLPELLDRVRVDLHELVPRHRLAADGAPRAHALLVHLVLQLRQDAGPEVEAAHRHTHIRASAYIHT